MSEKLHTPLPWKVYEPSCEAKVVWPGIDTDRPAGNISIAVMSFDVEDRCGIHGETSEQAFANARLIVAAVNQREGQIDALKAVFAFSAMVGGFTSRPSWWTDDASWQAWVEVSELTRKALKTSGDL